MTFNCCVLSVIITCLDMVTNNTVDNFTLPTIYISHGCSELATFVITSDNFYYAILLHLGSRHIGKIEHEACFGFWSCWCASSKDKSYQQMKEINK